MDWLQVSVLGGLVLTAIIVFIDIIIKQNTSLSRYLVLEQLHYGESSRLFLVIIIIRLRVGPLWLLVREIADELRVKDHCFVEGVIFLQGDRLTL